MIADDCAIPAHEQAFVVSFILYDYSCYSTLIISLEGKQVTINQLTARDRSKHI